MWSRTAAVAIFIWFFGTVAIRFVGHRVLRIDNTPFIIGLYVVSFAAMAVVVPLILRALSVSRDLWPRAAILLILPTLVLDPFSCLFFASVFPNLPLSTAGIFGGWMLICCGGGVTGAWIRS